MGPAVVRRLHALGHEVLIFHRGKTQAADLPPVQHLFGDRKDLKSYRPAIARFSPDVVLDMNLGTAQDAWTVVRTLDGLAARLVVPSSIDVYLAHGRVNGREPGPVHPGLFTEDAGPFRERLYPYRELAEGIADPEERRVKVDYEKLLVEHLVRASPGLPATILRLPMVYGPADFQHRLFGYLRAMSDGRPAIVMSDIRAEWRTSRGYVDNVADAIVLAVVRGDAAGKTYNVADDEVYRELDWVKQIAQLAKWPGEIVIVPDDELPEALRAGPGFRHHWTVDASRIRAELGYESRVATNEALRRTIAWELAHPPSLLPASDYADVDAVLTRRARPGR
jgi:nucleoside-diphosphate-sugar epimerase